MKKLFVIIYALFLIVFVIMPILLIVVLAFSSKENYFTLENFKELLKPVYFKILIRSIYLASSATLICLLIGYPAAWCISLLKKSVQNILIIAAVLPMWVNTLIRTYAWLRILGKNGFINTVLEFLGFQKLNLIYNEKAVLLGMIYNFLPFMILPIYTGLSKIPRDYINAARDLGASNLQILFYIKIPLTAIYTATGVVMVFIPSLTVFIISSILGGSKNLVVGNLIEKLFFSGNQNLGSALSFILILFIFIVNYFLLKFTKKEFN